MCIAAFVWQSHPRCPFLLLLNRDEYFDRGTAPLQWWDDDSRIVGGRDAVAGGTWLACSKDGKVAFVTNVRELSRLDKSKSRGHLPSRFLSGKKSLMEFAKEVVEEVDQYNGFNLIIADLHSKTMVYVTNRPKEENKFITEVLPGIHVLTNDTMLDSPWLKVFYGTRNTDAVSVNTTGEVTFYERYIDGDWHERNETFLIDE